MLSVREHCIAANIKHRATALGRGWPRSHSRSIGKHSHFSLEFVVELSSQPAVLVTAVRCFRWTAVYNRSARSSSEPAFPLVIIIITSVTIHLLHPKEVNRNFMAPRRVE